MSSGIGCSGPNHTRWDSGLQACVGATTQTSCDEANQDTCYYGFMGEGPARSATEPSPFGGKFVDEGFQIDMVPTLLRRCHFKPGEIVSLLNGRKISKKSLETFTPKSPVRYARVCRDSDGNIELILRKTAR